MEIDPNEKVEGIDRRNRLNTAVQDGLGRTQEYEDAKQFTGSMLGVVMGAKDLISQAVEGFPQAAAAWTGVTLVFEVGAM